MKHRILALLMLMLFFSIALISEDSIAASIEVADPEKGWAPFQLSIYTPAQLFEEPRTLPAEIDVAVWEKRGVRGLDLGLGVNSSDSFSGIQIAGIENSPYSDRNAAKDNV
jgi:hypothetical protein